MLARLGIVEPAASEVPTRLPRRRPGPAVGGVACALAAASFWFVHMPQADEVPPYRLLAPTADAVLRGPVELASGRYGLERKLWLVLRPARPTHRALQVRVYAEHPVGLVLQPAAVERDQAGALRLGLRPNQDALARAGETWQLRVLLGPEDTLEDRDFDPLVPPAGVQVFELALPLD